MKYLFILFIYILSGCATIQNLLNTQTHSLNPAIYYRQDICFAYELDKHKRDEFVASKWGSSFGSYKVEKNKLKFCGVGVLPYKPFYKITVNSPGKLNFFSLTSCHEEDTTENADRGIFNKNGRIKIRYKPDLEQGLACPLYVAAFSKRQRHAWGILAFEHPRFKLKARMRCNGYTAITNGVSMCQSRNGLVQELVFDEEVKLMDPVLGSGGRVEECPSLEKTTKDFKRFLFRLPKRECVYGFIGKKSRKIHKFYAIGYEDIILRGDK